MAMQLRRKSKGLYYTVVNTKTRMIQNWVQPGKTRLITNAWGTFWLRKSDFAGAQLKQRVILTEYTGKHPRLAVFMARVKEFFHG